MERQRERRAFTFLVDGEEDELHLSYDELDRRARAVAAHLQALGLAGGRAVLLFPPGLDYVAAFLGCLYAGTVAVPAYPLTGSRGLPRLQAILKDCEPGGVLTVAALRATVERALAPAGEVRGLCFVAVDDIADSDADLWRDPGIGADDLAFLQYTSGSTSTPKGVMISHGNLIANQRMIQEAFVTGESSIVVSWLPLYHDMGLIGGLLHPLWLGGQCVLLSPLHFLQRPVRWLQAISRYRASVSGGPNFSYDLCSRKVTAQEAAALDLSAWRVAFNGAEPVRAEVLERFAATFAGNGFRSSAFFPCYGLAEATLLVSGGRSAGEVPVLDADAEALAHDRVEPAGKDLEETRVRRLVSCGRIPSGLEVCVVDPASSIERPRGEVGEVWVAGASIAHGYWRRGRESAETFGDRLADGRGPFLRTGDLGFLNGGDLFIAGRIKDLILVRGRNLYPQDVEWTTERSHPAARPGCGAAFATETAGEERLVMVQEVSPRGNADLGEVAAAIRQAIAEEHEVQVSAIVLVKPGGVPKTTSGKIQRRACRDLFLAGGLPVLREWREGDGAGSRERVAPRTPGERRLALIWEEVLGLEPGTVGMKDNFFALGGDSVRGTQLLARLQEATGIVIGLEELFACATLADFVGQIGAVASRTGDHRGASLERADRTRPLPLTSPQRRLWFLDQLEPGNPAYILAVSVRLSGDLSPVSLAAALAEVSWRHEALRTVVRVVDGAPAQLVLPPGAPLLPLVDLSGLPDPARAASELEREQARQPFDLARGPLLRARLARLAPGEHELQLALHHIVSDGWSFGVLLREVAELYTALSRGLPSPLAELPVQYGDFACWQESRLAGETLAAQLSAWRQRLEGTLPVLALPTDRPRPPRQSYRGAHATRLLPPALERGLRELAGAQGASLFMALLAGFQALLQRIAAQDDLIVGTAVANRDRVELEGLIGFFVNTLPLRADLSGDPPFEELLRLARTTVLDALSGREVPFERLVDELPARRNSSATPLVQVMLVLQNEPLGVPPIPGLALSAREVDNGTARFDLAVSLMVVEEGLRAVFKYSRDLFDAATIERLAGHFEVLLAGAVAAPGRRLSDLPLLSVAERHQLLLEWNATEVAGLDGGCLHERIEEQVDRTPDGVALVYEDRSLTYRELDRRANQLACHLRRLGVGPEVLVGVAVERSPELVVGLLGVLKAGAAYLPLDPGYPADRLAYMIADATVPVLLTQERWRGELPSGSARVICLDSGWEAVAVESDARSAVEVGPENLAYVIYTSGSTGRPKGAMLSHRGIVNRLRWMQAEYRLVPGEGVLQKTPASFDVSVWELFWPLMVGARLVLARPGGHQDSAYLAGLIAAERITTLHFVPSMLQVFLEEPRLGECTDIRQVIASGEALPRDLADRFLSRTGAELHNLYGPTEASVDVTAWPCSRERGKPRPVPIGRPISNVRIHLLDRGGSAVPVGVPGHLHIGGAQLARGYLGRPDLTAERFVPDPFAQGGRLYATGDLARLRPDGAIEFLGRIDHQVKIRGFRIETGEIEAALNAHPAVRESVVLARGDGGGHRLVAYVVEHGGPGSHPPDVEGLRSFLARRLPDYMVPPVFVVLPALPLNPSGKVDRKALPAPEEQHRPEETPGLAPRTPVEERLAALWREVLGLEKVGVLDDFFALGGDSIQGALLVNRLQRELSSILYVMSLFDSPTVAKYAAYLEGSYRDALAAAGWIETGGGGDEPEAPSDEAAEIEVLSRYVATRFARPSRRQGAVEPRNPPAVFLLSPFRSGSTLLRVMLAGHPRLFAPPELELLGFETLGERRLVFSGRDSFSREGLLRAVMELRACDAEAAAVLMEQAEERDEPTPVFYRRLQEWAGHRGQRVLIDKTPRYALDLPTLRRAEDWFAEPLYIHLVRHPVGTMLSYLEARMQDVYHFPLPPRRQAELVWRLSHENVLEHLAAVPPERQRRIRFEEMVRDPRGVMEGLCAFLGIDFHPAMLSPYEGKRMTDGLHSAGRMMGDPKFHQHRGIDAGAADRWKDAPEAARLGEATWPLAERLGYRRPARPARPAPLAIPRAHRGDTGLPLSFAQQRLWFLDRLELRSSVYNMPAAVRLAGRLDVDALARACAEIESRHEVLRTVFPAVEGRPRQVVREPRTHLLPVVDLDALPGRVRRSEATRLIAEESLRPFDLAAGPLWRVRLLRLLPEEHILLVNLHHVVCDGWSVGLLTRELAALYEGSHLPELPIQYADFAAWQRARLAGPVLDELLVYWKERLTGPLPVLDLPFDRPRPQVQTYRGARLPLALAPERAAGLRELGRAAGATLFMSLAAAFQALLHRYTGQDDVLIGTPVAGRNRAEIENLIGVFVNTLVLRTDLSGDLDFRTLLRRVRRVTLDASRHEELPFERLVEELQVERALGYSPLFTVMLALQNAPPGRLALPGLAVERLDVDTRTAKLELTLDLTERPDGGLAGSLEYNADLFDATTAARLALHFANLAEGAVLRPEARLSELPLLSAPEAHQLRSEWNDTAEQRPAGALLHELFSARVAAAPHAPALVYEGRTLTYAELDRRADRLAGRLRSLGIGPDVAVGVLMERSVEMVVALLGALKAGGGYLPLDPEHPGERLAGMIEEAQAPVLLAQERLLPVLPTVEAQVVLLEEGWDGSSAEGGGSVLSEISDESLAYVLYTSGSTGRPKGVMIPHRGIVNRLLWMQEAYDLSPDDRVLQKTPYSFDVSVWELFWPLITGACLVVARPGGHRDAAYLAGLIARERVTVTHFVPSMLQVFLAQPDLSGCAGLRLVVASGEALSPELRRRFRERLPARLENLYGPTEASVDVTAWNCAEAARGGVVPIGRPVANTGIHLLDRSFRPVPIGVAGELCIGGVQLARGYRGRPDLTAERFVPDPFGPAGGRLYRTGDLARHLPDGAVEYLGRFDHQVKIHGFRIEIGEIEAALLAQPAVRQCVVVAAGDGADRRLVAYVVREGDLAWDELRSALREKLPLYMVPSAVAFLDRFPLLPSGKVDRKSLPDPGRDRPDLAASYVSPRNEKERVIAKVWQEVLGLDRVGIHDNFFDLGGHSLLAAEVHGKLRERLEGAADFPLIELFQHPTVHALAGRLVRAGEEDGLAGVQDLARREREAAQRRRKALAARQRGGS